MIIESNPPNSSTLFFSSTHVARFMLLLLDANLLTTCRCVALCRRTAERASIVAHPRNNNFERPRCISRQFNRGLGFAILELAQLLSVCDSQFRRALVSFPAVRRFPTMFLSLPAKQGSPILTLFQPTTPLALHCLSSSLMEFYSIAAPPLTWMASSRPLCTV